MNSQLKLPILLMDEKYKVERSGTKMRSKSKNPVTLAKWIWNSYLRTALLPVLLIVALFLGVYFSIDIMMRDRLYNLLRFTAQTVLSRVAALEASAIGHELDCVRISTELYAAQMKTALVTPANLNPADAVRLVASPEGAYFTASDGGGAAVYYSGRVPVGAGERQKVARALSTQGLMKDILATNPLITSVYLNTYDSLNVIYPYIDVATQYVPGIDITAFNFYYEADRVHNPGRAQRWTGAYLDPAGHGWMVSSVAPVYNGDFLEGVVGADVTVGSMTEQIIKTALPDGGYALLAGSDSTILALPEEGAADWGLEELKVYNDDQAVLQDTFKPDSFNLLKRPDTADFSSELTSRAYGVSSMTLGGDKKIVAWDTIAQTGWKLLLIFPESAVYDEIDSIGGGLQKVGFILATVLVLFLALLLQRLNVRSKRMSEQLSSPILEFNRMVQSIGAGDYYQKMPEFGVRELQDSSVNLVNMGIRLGETNANLLAAQEALREKETYLRAVISSIDDTIIELDAYGVITNFFISEDFEEIKLPRGFASIDSIFDKDTAARLMEKLREVIDTGKSGIVEAGFGAEDGMRWVHARLSLVSRDPFRVVVTARDITERKKMEESISKARDEAEEASRAKTRFLSNMSHELRTPLNAVLGFAQILEMDPAVPLNVMQKECVYEIMKAGNHLLELINEVLDLARIESGKARLSIEPVALIPLIEETLTMILPIAEKNGIRVDTDHLNCGDTYVLADRTKLKQILINLLSNAVKYNKPNGRMELYRERVGDRVRLHVTDTGIGIPESELDAIFKPFYRLNKTNNVIEGTGVGLAVVKELTEMMGGVIRVRSVEGKGSHFTIELPAAEELTLWSEKSGVTEKTVREIGTLPANKKILYIEDNQANLRLVERVVELMPNTVFLWAHTGGDGIMIARREKPDVILLDINLPDMDGYEVFQTLQEYEDTGDIPVIAVSSNAAEREIGRAMRMGFFDYITKPIKADTFLERIKRVFNGKQK